MIPFEHISVAIWCTLWVKNCICQIYFHSNFVCYTPILVMLSLLWSQMICPQTREKFSTIP